MAASLSDVVDGVLAWGERTAGDLDEAGFQTLYAAVSRPLSAYLQGVTGRRDVAEDLVQETFCRYLVRRPRTMPEDETRRYLFRIATNLLRDRWRRQEDVPAPEASDEGCATDVAMQMDVRRAMRMLKPRERELLWLAYVEGMSHAEIAKVTGLNAMSVRLLLFRARGRAAELLEPGKSEV